MSLSPSRVAALHIARVFGPENVENWFANFRSSIIDMDVMPERKPPPEAGSLEMARWRIRFEGRWADLVRWGKFISTWVVETRSIPAGSTKAVEVATRTFLSTKLKPRDVAAWWEKNKRYAVLLLSTYKWPERGTATQDGIREMFTLGAFTVHNTLHLEGDKLTSTEAVVEKAEKVIRKFPKLARVLYGDIFIVGRLQQPRTLAWYNIEDDKVYVRPQKLSEEELINLTHELGHRYWFKFLGNAGQREWHTLFYLKKNTNVPSASLPKPGEPLGILVKGKDNPVVEAIVPDFAGNLQVKLVGGGYISANVVRNELSNQQLRTKFPSRYAMTSAVEFFAETFAYYVVGGLSPENTAEFEKTVGL